MMNTQVTPVVELFGGWEQREATIHQMLKAAERMPQEEAERQRDVISVLKDERDVLEERMSEVLDGTPAAALCKLRVALSYAKLGNGGVPPHDLCWEMVQSATEDLLVAVTPRQAFR